MSHSQLKKDVDCYKCWDMLDCVDSKHWPKVCPKCGRRHKELLELEKRYFDEAE